MKDARTKLLILYIIITVVLGLRIKVESTGYLSLDSQFYLRTATNITNGKGPITPVSHPFKDTTPEAYTAIWPPGYPTLIAAVSYLSDFDASISSKIVNAIFLGFIFILLYHRFGANSIFPALYFCSFSMLEIYSYSWSEGVFLFFLIWTLYLLEIILIGHSSKIHLSLLVLGILSMVILRYAGLILFFFLFLIVVFLINQRRYNEARKFIFVLLFSGFFIISFLLINYFLTGGFFGGAARIFPLKESLTLFFSLLGKGVLNEFLIIRNFYWNWDTLFFLTLAVQLLVCVYLIRNRKFLRLKFYKDLNSKVALASGIFYLIFLIVLRKLSPFESFDYRILAPFSAPIFISVLGNLEYKGNAGKISRIKMVISSFFIFSLAMNLPKEYILKWLGIDLVFSDILYKIF